MTTGEPESVSSISCRVVAAREDDSRWWSFYLINDEDSPLGSAVLDKVCYEWADQYLETKEPNECVMNLAPGDRARIWRDDGESETRIDLWLTIEHRGQRGRFLFEFPKLYKQTGNHLDGLGPGA
ncbi:MAG: hypothetical protein KY459_12450 [Acidobacteria bacterium]|nr:hypothetical protein [Acidobacteriota bacterium]